MRPNLGAWWQKLWENKRNLGQRREGEETREGREEEINNKDIWRRLPLLFFMWFPSNTNWIKSSCKNVSSQCPGRKGHPANTYITSIAMRKDFKEEKDNFFSPCHMLFLFRCSLSLYIYIHFFFFPQFECHKGKRGSVFCDYFTPYDQQKWKKLLSFPTFFKPPFSPISLNKQAHVCLTWVYGDKEVVRKLKIKERNLRQREGEAMESRE